MGELLTSSQSSLLLLPKVQIQYPRQGWICNGHYRALALTPCPVHLLATNSTLSPALSTQKKPFRGIRASFIPDSGMSMSQKLTLGYAVLVGGGGVMGSLKGGSKISLFTGGLSALLLCYIYTVLPTNPVFASSLGLGLSVVLLAVMVSRWRKTGKIFPAGLVAFVSLIMSCGYLHGILRSLH